MKTKWLFGIILLTTFCQVTLAKSIVEFQAVDSLRAKIYLYGKRGHDYLKNNIDLDSAAYYLKKAIDLQISTTGYGIDDRVANNYILLASYYRTIYDNEEAIKCYTEAERILKEHSPQTIHLALLYHNKGNVYKELGDLYMTKEYYEYAHNLFIKTEYQNTESFVLAFSNYIKLLLELDQNEEASIILSSMDMAMIENKFIKHRLHVTYASTYAQLDEYELALNHFKKAEQIIKKEPNIDAYINQMIVFFYAYIDFFYMYSQYSEALSKCDEAFSYIESLAARSTKGKIRFECDILYRAAAINLAQGELDLALYKTNQAIEKLQAFLLDLSYGNEQEAQKREHNTSIPDLQVQKSKILLGLYQESNESRFLYDAYYSYKRAIELLNSMRLSMGREYSKIFATAQIIEIYSEAVMVALELWNNTGDYEYLAQSFFFTESSKAFALFSEFKNVDAIQFSDLPEETRKLEGSLLGEIQAYEKLIYDELVADFPDGNLVADLKEKLFHLRDDYNDLMAEIEKVQNYYELKYASTFISIDSLQNNLSYSDAVIEYVLSDSILIAYIVDKEGVATYQKKLDPEFEAECLEYYGLMSDQNFSSNVRVNFNRYIELSRKLYGILIEPALEHTSKKNLTIVPDGAISYIPFEILLNEDVDTAYIDYMNLPYLIRDFSIGYSHSASLLFDRKESEPAKHDKVLAFAPSYKSPELDFDTTGLRGMEDTIQVLMPLVGTIREVQELRNIVPADVFLNELATESQFKTLAEDYRVLHLAMHTLMLDDDPLYSMMAFSNVDNLTSGEDDNRLFAYEIYGLPLNADLAVLSSCSSGYGKLQRGEGMMSLARGFIYSGCPSIVMTLWQVADKSSAELVVAFYKYLKKGHSKQEALRLAKLDYLKSADDLTSNPYFWAGFVVLGDNSAIYPKTSISYWMLLIAAFVAGVILIQFKRRKKV